MKDARVKTRVPHWRTRKQDNRLPRLNAITIDYVSYAGSYSSTAALNNIVQNGSFRTTTDFVTPGASRILASGHDLSHDFSSNYEVIECNSGSATYKNFSDSNPAHWSLATWRGSLATFVPPIAGSDPAWLTNDLATYKQQLLVEVIAKAHSPDFNGSLFAAEAIKTMGLFTNPVKGIGKLLAKMIKRRTAFIDKGLTLTAASSKAWLQYRYGWKPLMYDVRDLSVALLKSERVPGLVLRARVKRDLVYRNTSAQSLLWGNTSWRVYGTTKRDHHITVRSGVRYRITDSSVNQFRSSSLGLSLDNVVSTAWEIVPFSFVLDWFYNVGDWLRAITPAPGVSIESTYVSTQQLRSYHTIFDRMDVAKYAGSSIWTTNPGFSDYRKTVLFKDRAVNLPVPTHPIITPDMLSLARQADSFALIVTKFMKDVKLFKH